MSATEDILDLVQESVVVRGLDGRIRRWNKASENLYGWTRGDAEGRLIHELLKTRRELIEPLEAALRAQGHWEGEITRTDATGTIVILWLQCTRQVDAAEIVETAVDITRLRRVEEALSRAEHRHDVPEDKKAKTAQEASEQRYRTLFHFLPVAMVQLDRTELADVFEKLHTQGVNDLLRYFEEHPGFYEYATKAIRVIEVNRRAIELFNADDERQLLGPGARLWSEAPEIIRQSMAARFRGASQFQSEMKIRTFDGQIRDVLYVAYFPEAFRQHAIGLSCLVDISDRVKAQAMLTQVQAEFAHAARVSMLGELTASIAHELNQPLAAILTNGEAALRWLNRAEPDLAELRALSTRTVADAYRAADIIGRIRSMATHGQPEQSPLALNSVVEDVMLFLRPELRRQRVEAQLDLAPDLPDVVADRVQLQQVFANLAVNAMHAMAESGERRLTIRTTRDDGRTISAEVEDTGHGISTDHLPRLFQSFFTTKDAGMGIGLAICRSIIEAHGGRIEATNLAQGGARFRFTLPAADSHTEV